MNPPRALSGSLMLALLLVASATPAAAQQPDDAEVYPPNDVEVEAVEVVPEEVEEVEVDAVEVVPEAVEVEAVEAVPEVAEVPDILAVGGVDLVGLVVIGLVLLLLGVVAVRGLRTPSTGRRR